MKRQVVFLLAFTVPLALGLGSLSISATSQPRPNPATPNPGRPARPVSPGAYPPPPPDGLRPPAPRTEPYSRNSDQRQMDRAVRDLERAADKAAQVNDWVSQNRSERSVLLIRYAQQFLDEAQSAYNANDYFRSAELAKASDNLYEAAKNQLEADLGYVVDRYGAAQPSRSYYEAPYKVSEELERTEAEAEYYQSNDRTVAELMDQSRSLANPLTPASTVSNPDFANLANNRAAIHIARAARHLIAVDRGF